MKSFVDEVLHVVIVGAIVVLLLRWLFAVARPLLPVLLIIGAVLLLLRVISTTRRHW